MNKVLCSKCQNECNENDKFCSNCGDNIVKDITFQKEELEVQKHTETPTEKSEIGIQEYSSIDDVTPILNWFLGMISVIIAINFMSHSLIICGIIFFAISAILIPPVKTYIENKGKFNISTPLKIGFIMFGLILTLVLAGMKTNQEHYESNLKLAKNSMASKEYNKAIEYYAIAKEAKPNSEEAKNGFIKATKLNEEKKKADSQLHLSKGNKYFSAGKWEQAVNEYNQAISMDKSVNGKISNKLNKAQQLLTKQRKAQELALAKKEKAQERARIIEQMQYFEGDAVQVAVGRVKVTRSTDSHVAIGNSRFIWINVATKNATSGTAHVNPNDFTLSDGSGYTVSHESDTYSLDNYFNAVNLPPNGETSGWLIFCLPKDNEYILHYNGFDGSVDKKIAIK